MMGFEQDYLFKLIIIGNAGTGKSSLLFRLCNNTFNEAYISTIGIDFKTKTFEIGDDTVKLQIWDTAGQERFKSIISSYYRGANGVIIVFDLNDKKSFDDIDDWMYERDMKCKSNFCTLIIGTKSDIKKKDLITDDMISELCIKYNASYIETSAKYDINIVDAFKLICKKLIEKNNPSYNSFKSSIIQNHNKKINCCLLS